MWQQKNQYWAADDVIKIHDNRDDAPPCDDFRKDFHPMPRTKFLVSDKPTNVNHWKLSDKVGDPVIRQGWKPNLKWSDKEASHLCNGKDKDFRTFDKIVNN